MHNLTNGSCLAPLYSKLRALNAPLARVMKHTMHAVASLFMLESNEWKVVKFLFADNRRNAK